MVVTPEGNARPGYETATTTREELASWPRMRPPDPADVAAMALHARQTRVWERYLPDALDPEEERRQAIAAAEARYLAHFRDLPPDDGAEAPSAPNSPRGSPGSSKADSDAIAALRANYRRDPNRLSRTPEGSRLARARAAVKEGRFSSVESALSLMAHRRHTP